MLADAVGTLGLLKSAQQHAVDNPMPASSAVAEQHAELVLSRLYALSDAAASGGVAPPIPDKLHGLQSLRIAQQELRMAELANLLRFQEARIQADLGGPPGLIPLGSTAEVAQTAALLEVRSILASDAAKRSLDGKVLANAFADVDAVQRFVLAQHEQLCALQSGTVDADAAAKRRVRAMEELMLRWEELVLGVPIKRTAAATAAAAAASDGGALLRRLRSIVADEPHVMQAQLQRWDRGELLAALVEQIVANANVQSVGAADLADPSPSPRPVPTTKQGAQSQPTPSGARSVRFGSLVPIDDDSASGGTAAVETSANTPSSRELELERKLRSCEDEVARGRSSIAQLESELAAARRLHQAASLRAREDNAHPEAAAKEAAVASREKAAATEALREREARCAQLERRLVEAERGAAEELNELETRLSALGNERDHELRQLQRAMETLEAASVEVRAVERVLEHLQSALSAHSALTSAEVAKLATFEPRAEAQSQSPSRSELLSTMPSRVHALSAQAIDLFSTQAHVMLALQASARPSPLRGLRRVARGPVGGSPARAWWE
jgi:hypothetical protein